MSSVVSQIFTLAQRGITVMTANPLLAILIGISIATAIFLLVARLFIRRGR